MVARKKEFYPEYINDFYLMLTEKCPLRCEYCYIKDRANGPTITKEIMNQFMNKMGGRKPRVIFFGGEPLLELDLMDWFVNKYDNQCTAFQVVTSGIVNLEAFVERIYKKYNHKFDLQISWDGISNTRKLANNLSVAKLIDSKIKYLIEQKIDFQVRSVINDTNINDLYNMFIQYSNYYKFYSNFYADFTIAHQTNFHEEFANSYKEQLNKILNKIENELSNKNDTYIPQFLLHMFIGILNNKPIAACNIGSELIIRPNGDIYPCTMLSQASSEFCLGNILSKSLDTSKIETSMQRAEKCLSCDYSKACLGGCRYERITLFGDLNSVNESYCAQTKVVYDTISSWISNIDAEIHHALAKKCSQFIAWNSCCQSKFYSKAKEFKAKR